MSRFDYDFDAWTFSSSQCDTLFSTILLHPKCSCINALKVNKIRRLRKGWIQAQELIRLRGNETEQSTHCALQHFT